MSAQCPDSPRWAGDLVGCGSSNVTDADDEGYRDCLNCGLFFTDDDAEPVFRVTSTSVNAMITRNPTTQGTSSVPQTCTLLEEASPRTCAHKAEIAAAESPKYRTNRVFRFVEEDTNRTVNLAIVSDVMALLKIAAHVQGQHEFYNQAAANIVGDLKDAPAFTWCGYSLSDWFADIKAQVSKIQVRAKQEKLASLEARLDKLVSPEKREQMELAAIQAELNK